MDTVVHHIFIEGLNRQQIPPLPPREIFQQNEEESTRSYVRAETQKLNPLSSIFQS